MRIEGYRGCSTPGCEGICLEIIAAATAGQCVDCFQQSRANQVQAIDVIVEGVKFPVSNSERQRARNRRTERRRAGRPRGARKRAARSARLAAALRLARLYRLEYLILLGDERERYGLPRWDHTHAIEFARLCERRGLRADDVTKTLDILAAYAADDAQAQAVATPRGTGSRAARDDGCGRHLEPEHPG